MSSPKQRRIAPRVAIPADWSVTYRADDSRTGVWRDARLIDLSKTGVAIEPSGLAADETSPGCSNCIWSHHRLTVRGFDSEARSATRLVRRSDVSASASIASGSAPTSRSLSACCSARPSFQRAMDVQVVLA